MFMSVTMESAVFMGKNFQNNQNSIVNTADLTLKQMFDISAKLVAEQDEISNLETIGWEKHSWKYLSLIDDERIINLQRTKVYVFSDSVLCLGRIHQHPESNEAWKKRIEWITSSQSYRDFDGISGAPTEFEWNIFPGLATLQLCGNVTDLLSRLGEAPETFTGRILFMLMFTTSYLYGKHGIEIRIWSMRKDNSPSWVRISHGSNKFVIDSNHNNTEIAADLPEEQASQSIVKVFAARSKAKAKPQRREPVDASSIISMNKRKLIDIEPGESSFSAYEVSKKVVNLLRQEEDSSIFFDTVKRYRIIIKTILVEEERIHYSITIWFTNLFLCLKP